MRGGQADPLTGRARVSHQTLKGKKKMPCSVGKRAIVRCMANGGKGAMSWPKAQGREREVTVDVVLAMRRGMQVANRS